MRLSRPLLRSLKNGPPATSSGNGKISTALLSSLKAAQLQHVAFLAGISSSGTKGVLAERLSRSLQGDDETTNSRVQRGEEMRILSIDMGIRNLAYAHLIVSRPSDTVSMGKKRKTKTSANSRTTPVVLDAWNRLAVSSIPVTEHPGDEAVQFALDKFNNGEDRSISRKRSSKPKPKRKAAKADTSQDTEIEEGTGDKVDSSSSVSSTGVEKESFSPDVYASHAYMLITSLIRAYNPTHVLIERQRFRSAGGSAVLEWTIRVGVFEGMLYAVLQTLKSERSKLRKAGLLPKLQEASGNGDLAGSGTEDISVHGVQPQRVAKYWVEMTKGIELDEDKGKECKTKRRMTSQEGKKAKIDVIGAMLSAEESGELPSSLVSMGTQVRVGDNVQARNVVSAFLDKWHRSKTRGKVSSSSLFSDSAAEGTPDSRQLTRKKSTTKGKAKAKAQPTSKLAGPVIEVGKLDDLADCLLQGLTWLEWRNMRERIASEGLAAVPFPDD